MAKCPEKYRKVCELFVREFFAARKRQLENDFLLQVCSQGQKVVLTDPLGTPLGKQVVEIARAAAGELPDDASTRAIVAEGIQDLMEQLFAPPGLAYAYSVPGEFWNAAPFGRMVRDANLWVRGDELITQTEAARLLEISVRAVGMRIGKGLLSVYIDDSESNPRKNRRVSRLEVIAWMEKRGRGRGGSDGGD